MALDPNTPFLSADLPEDMDVLKKALAATLSTVPGLFQRGSEQRILNLACGRADETGVLADVFGGGAGRLEIVGADIRSAEIEEASLRWKTAKDSDIQTRFHVEDGKRFLSSMSSGDRFNLTFMRHQNFWNDPALWTRMFEGGLRQLDEDGLFVITSYFDVEHDLACRKLTALGATKVADYRNVHSRELSDAPGKSIDRHIAIFRRPPPSNQGP
ncbi:MAG: hypothetical protein CMO35_02975 [Verrucomicrobiaceae bacterium]|nr:hypothetical protein [Verrucomicrobiaceae bacterium]